MSKSLKVASLAAAIALAMGSTAAMAATPTATQLPGKGSVATTVDVSVTDPDTGVVTTETVASANASIDATTNTMDVTLLGDTVINWGQGTGINKDGVAGFNVGSDATVNFTGGYGVLNIDKSGAASQIMGHVNAADNVFVANANGIIVGAKGAIVSTGGDVGLIANTIGADQTAFAGAAPAFNGTGGDVTVTNGATLTGTNVLVSGGGNVNVGLSNITGALTLSAGLNGNGGAFADTNEAAQLNLTGDHTFAATDVIASAGDASSAGDVTLGTSGAVDVAGTFTNSGNLIVDGNTFSGALDNENTVTGGAFTAGALVNNGTIGSSTVSVGAIETTDGGITNNGAVYGGAITAAGDFTNAGTLSSSGAVSTGAFTNDGTITIGGNITTVGNFANSGSIKGTGALSISATDGSIDNAGELDGFSTLDTISSDDFEAGADYSITNSGTIVSTGGFSANANATTPFGDNNRSADAANDTTGSFTNTGKLSVGVSATLDVYANDDVAFGGSLTANAKALSATNPLVNADIEAANGALTISAPLVTNDYAFLYGAQAKILADVTDVSVDGTVSVNGGHLEGADYDIRIAAGKTVSGQTVYVDSFDGTTTPSVILQGTVAGNSVYMGSGGDFALGDVFTGPDGSIEATGTDPSVTFNFTGRVKSAPYLNSSNFRYNYLPITVTDDTAVNLYLNPLAYTTNGTENGLAAVNILVNGGVNLFQNAGAADSVGVDGTAVSGITNVPNTHLVLQSTGDIDVQAAYWPGYVYLGTISADADGNAQPGTLGFGQISTAGTFSNVLPGSVGGASGIHFMTQLPLALGGPVVTNANAWVNFATDTLTNGYANGALTGTFYGGVKSDTSNVVTYGKLDASMFHTHPVDASK